MRVVEVWWDDYKKYFYERKPSAKNVDPGDLTAQKAIREKLQCKSFDWFMKEIAYDLPKFFPLIEPTNGAKGSLNFLTPRLSAWPLRGHRVLKSILEDILQPTKSKM